MDRELTWFCGDGLKLEMARLQKLGLFLDQSRP